MDKKHLEFSVKLKRGNDNRILRDKNDVPQIESKEPTKRGFVMISEKQALWHNQRSMEKDFLYYELAPSKKEPKTEK